MHFQAEGNAGQVEVVPCIRARQRGGGGGEAGSRWDAVPWLRDKHLLRVGTGARRDRRPRSKPPSPTHGPSRALAPQPGCTHSAPDLNPSTGLVGPLLRRWMAPGLAERPNLTAALPRALGGSCARGQQQ